MPTLSRGGFVRVLVNVDGVGLCRVRGGRLSGLVGMRAAGGVVPVVPVVPVVRLWWCHGGSASTLTNASANMSDDNVDSGQRRCRGPLRRQASTMGAAGQDRADRGSPVRRRPEAPRTRAVGLLCGD